MTTIETEAGKEQAYVAVPSGGSGPGVLVLHAWWGLTPFFEGLCDRLAEAGFVALAPDLNAGQVATTIEEAEALMKARNWDRTGAAAKGGLAALRAHPAVRAGSLGAIGFSMGAGWAIHLAGERPDDLAAVVVFYGTGGTDFTQARAAFLGHFADPDDWEPAEEVQAMEQAMHTAGREATLHRYPGVGHWFFESDRPDAYQAEAAELAWTRTLEFLRRSL